MKRYSGHIKDLRHTVGYIVEQAGMTVWLTTFVVKPCTVCQIHEVRLIKKIKQIKEEFEKLRQLLPEEGEDQDSCTDGGEKKQKSDDKEDCGD